MKISQWHTPDSQMCRIGDSRWSVARLFELARTLPVMDIPLDHLNINYCYDNLNLREMAMHMKAVNDADLSFPIIIDENGDVMDGRHRIMKAMLTGAESIKAVRFEENPSPCQVTEE